MSPRVYRVAASLLRGAAHGVLIVGGWATPILRLSRWCEDRAWRAEVPPGRPPEWLPRLWDRDHHTDFTEPPR